MEIAITTLLAFEPHSKEMTCNDEASVFEALKCRRGHRPSNGAAARESGLGPGDAAISGWPYAGMDSAPLLNPTIGSSDTLSAPADCQSTRAAALPSRNELPVNSLRSETADPFQGNPRKYPRAPANCPPPALAAGAGSGKALNVWMAATAALVDFSALASPGGSR
jgi:hypothetical protein